MVTASNAERTNAARDLARRSRPILFSTGAAVCLAACAQLLDSDAEPSFPDGGISSLADVGADSPLKPPESPAVTDDVHSDAAAAVPEASVNGTSFCSSAPHNGCWDFDESQQLQYGCPDCWDSLFGGAGHVAPPGGPDSGPNAFVVQLAGDTKSYLYKTYKVPATTTRVVVSFDVKPLPCDSSPYYDFATLAIVKFGSFSVPSPSESMRVELKLTGTNHAYGAYAGQPPTSNDCTGCRSVGFSPGVWQRATFDLTSTNAHVGVANATVDIPWSLGADPEMEISIGLRSTKYFTDCEVSFDNVTVDLSP